MSDFHSNDTHLITGTFLQLDHWDDTEGARFQQQLRAMTPDEWRQMLRDMAAIGIDTLVIQQSLDGRGGCRDMRAYYPSRRYPVPGWMRKKPFLYDEIVDEAELLGMTVLHGICPIHGPDPYRETAEAVALGTATAYELMERYGGRRGFGGWYWAWEYPPGSVSGRDCLKRIVPEIRRVADAPFMIAPNIDRGICAAVLADIDVDICAYQDTVGLGVEPDIFGRHARAGRYQSLHRLPVLYEMAKFAHDGWVANEPTPAELWNFYRRERGRTALWNDLEIWEFNHKRELLPTELSRVVAQLELTAPFVDKQIIYQYPGLMCHPDHPARVGGGERAVTLYETYALYRESLLRKLK